MPQIGSVADARGAQQVLPASAGPGDAIVRSQAELQWPQLIEQLVIRCATPFAAERARDLPLATERRAIEEMLEAVEQARRLADLGRVVPWGVIADIRPVVQRLAKEGVLSGPSLRAVADTLQNIALVARFLRAHRAEAPSLAALADPIDELEFVWGAIQRACEPDGELADDASAELAASRRRVAELRRRITEHMKGLLGDPQLAKFLQDDFYTQRDDRYVLPVRTDAGPVVEGIVLGASASGATVFVEPRSVFVLNNELKVAQVAELREVARILAELSRTVTAVRDQIARNLELVTSIDAICARARLAEAMVACRPRLADDGGLALRQLRHPLMALGDTRVVANDVALGPRQALLISGPNAGGKSVCLKGIGLCALMLRGGMHLPVASDSVMPVYATVLSDIGDDQSIERNLSTFTGHLQRMIACLDLADADTLVLLDEVATGTDPIEGAALGQALLEQLVTRAAHVVVTTHYERLKALASLDARFTNASFGFDRSGLRPTFELHAGSAGSSFALTVARHVGLDSGVLGRAMELLGEGDQRVMTLLEQLTDQRERVQAELRAAEAARAAAQRSQEVYENKLVALRQQGERAWQQAHAAALNELKRARAELESVRTALKAARHREQLKEIERRLGAAAGVMRHHEPPRPDRSGGGPALPADDVRPGLRVYVPDLGAVAEVVETRGHGRVVVAVGSVHAEVSADALRRARTASPGKNAKPAQDTAATPASIDQAPTLPARSPDNTFDARGLRVDEALREVELFVDHAIGASRDVVYVVHGHGTGALRSALRANLRLSPAVERIASAPPELGGDAVTTVWLR